MLALSVLVSSKAVKNPSSDLPSFSLPSGFYDGETLNLEININDPDAIIYYTLDGSLPSENSSIHKTPFTLKNKSEEENVISNIKGTTPRSNFEPSIKVKKGNIIRVIAKLSDGTITDVVSGTYFVGLNKKKLYGDLPVISIITDPDNLFNYENGIYVLGKDYDDWIKKNPENVNVDNYLVKANYSRKGKQSERPATIEYIPGNSTTVDFFQDIGLRLKGSGTRYQYQKSFKIVSREDYGKKNINYKIIPDNIRSDGNGPVTKYKSFILRNGGNDSEYAKMRDNVIQGLSRNPYFETQQYDISIVFVDGEYWGFYNVYEEYSDHYIANNYNIDNKNVIIVKVSKIEAGEDEDIESFNNLKQFVLETDMSIPKNYEKLSKMFDVVGFAWYAAISAYTYIRDGWFFNNNWSIWRVKDIDASVPKADGKWRMMMYDTKYSTGIYGSAKPYDDDLIRYALNITNFPKVTNSFGSQFTNSLVKNENLRKCLLTFYVMSKTFSSVLKMFIPKLTK